MSVPNVGTGDSVVMCNPDAPSRERGTGVRRSYLFVEPVSDGVQARGCPVVEVDLRSDGSVSAVDVFSASQ